MLAAEHQAGRDPEAWRRDRLKHAALREMGWTTLSIVSDDVRRHPRQMVGRIDVELSDRVA